MPKKVNTPDTPPWETPSPALWIGPQPTDPKPIIYLSGNTGATPTARYPVDGYYAKDGANIRFRCYSFANLYPGSKMFASGVVADHKVATKYKVRAFLDSGAFSFQQNPSLVTKDHLETYCRDYATYMAEHTWDFAVTLDYRKECKLVYAVTKELRDKHGAKVVPVYHGDDSLDWVRKYADEGHKLIGLGRTARLGSDALHQSYAKAFNLGEKLGLVFHGFMVTGRNMFEFPWYSVDSATWVKAAGHGFITLVDAKRKHVMTIPMSAKRVNPKDPCAKAVADQYGFDLQEMIDHYGARMMFNARQFSNVNIDPKTYRRTHQWENVLGF